MSLDSLPPQLRNCLENSCLEEQVSGFHVLSRRSGLKSAGCQDAQEPESPCRAYVCTHRLHLNYNPARALPLFRMLLLPAVRHQSCPHPGQQAYGFPWTVLCLVSHELSKGLGDPYVKTLRRRGSHFYLWGYRIQASCSYQQCNRNNPQVMKTYSTLHWNLEQRFGTGGWAREEIWP